MSNDCFGQLVISMFIMEPPDEVKPDSRVRFGGREKRVKIFSTWLNRSDCAGFVVRFKEANPALSGMVTAEFTMREIL